MNSLFSLFSAMTGLCSNSNSTFKFNVTTHEIVCHGRSHLLDDLPITIETQLLKCGACASLRYGHSQKMSVIYFVGDCEMATFCDENQMPSKISVSIGAIIEGKSCDFCSTIALVDNENIEGAFYLVYKSNSIDIFHV